MTICQHWLLPTNIFVALYLMRLNLYLMRLILLLKFEYTHFEETGLFQANRFSAEYGSSLQ